MVNVYDLDIGSICIREKELLGQFSFHQENTKSHNETDVRYI